MKKNLLENLVKRETPKGVFLFCKVNKKGKSIKELLPQIIKNLINKKTKSVIHNRIFEMKKK